MVGAFSFSTTAPEKLQDKYDVVIVGSGATGLTCALQAHELGLQPLVVEKMAKIGGNTNRASSGMNAAETNVQLQHGIVDSFAEFYQETYHGGGYLNDPQLLRYFSTHAVLALDWLSAHGIELSDLTLTGGMSKKRAHRPASTAPIGAFLIQGLLQALQQQKIPLVTETTVTRLLRSTSGATQGVEVKFADGTKKTLHSKVVVLATGGFGASKELLQKYRPDLLRYRTTNHAGATGDGLRLAHQVGAELMQMNLIQVHPTVQQDNPHAFLIGEAVRGEGALLVSKGKRFVNELDTRRIVSNQITALPEKSAYLVFDQQVRERVKAIDFYLKIGLVVTASSIAELAQKVGFEAAKLEETVKTWNQAVERGLDPQFGRTTGFGNGLTTAPYYAIHVAPAVHYTMGGIHINEKTQVLDGNGDVIPGLLAAGEVAGGLHGNNRIGGNSIAETIVFGRQAGQQAKVFTEQG
ncbi:MAG: flavocytochrome c [Liquorilactobacillus satsumensis]|uniref:flavocytochrome c n=1 Tax=Liquorilactobacillus satsumensis TaxID=259059 RepID=UPI0039EBF9F7